MKDHNHIPKKYLYGRPISNAYHVHVSYILLFFFYWYYFVDLAKLSSFHKINNSHDDAFSEFVRKVALMTEFPLCLGSSSSSHQFSSVQ